MGALMPLSTLIDIFWTFWRSTIRLQFWISELLILLHWICAGGGTLVFQFVGQELTILQLHRAVKRNELVEVWDLMQSSTCKKCNLVRLQLWEFRNLGKSWEMCQYMWKFTRIGRDTAHNNTEALSEKLEIFVSCEARRWEISKHGQTGSTWRTTDWWLSEGEEIKSIWMNQDNCMCKLCIQIHDILSRAQAPLRQSNQFLSWNWICFHCA